MLRRPNAIRPEWDMNETDGQGYGSRCVTIASAVWQKVEDVPDIPVLPAIRHAAQADDRACKNAAVNLPARIRRVVRNGRRTT